MAAPWIVSPIIISLIPWRVNSHDPTPGGSPTETVWSDSGVAWLLLAGAIVTELFGTLGLRRLADGFLWWPVALIAVLYTTSFTFMTLALRSLNVAVVYAIWSAFGTAAISIAGVL